MKWKIGFGGFPSSSLVSQIGVVLHFLVFPPWSCVCLLCCHTLSSFPRCLFSLQWGWSLLSCYRTVVMVATHSSLHFLHFPVISAVTCFALSPLVYVASLCDCCVLLLFHGSWKKCLIFLVTVETWLCREDGEGTFRIDERSIEFPSSSFSCCSKGGGIRILPLLQDLLRSTFSLVGKQHDGVYPKRRPDCVFQAIKNKKKFGFCFKDFDLQISIWITSQE